MNARDSREKLARATLALAIALTVAGCGQERRELIPRGDADQILEQLSTIRDQFDSNLCQELQINSIGTLDTSVNSLGADVDAEVRQALEDGVDRLATLAIRDCEEPEPVETTPTETTPAPETTPTDTTPTEPPDEKPPRDDKPVPPGQNGTPPGQDDTPPGDEGPGGGTSGEEGD